MSLTVLLLGGAGLAFLALLAGLSGMGAYVWHLARTDDARARHEMDRIFGAMELEAHDDQEGRWQEQPPLFSHQAQLGGLLAASGSGPLYVLPWLFVDAWIPWHVQLLPCMERQEP